MNKNNPSAPVWGLTRRLYALSVLVSMALVAVVAYAYIGLSDVRARAEKTKAVRVPQLLAMTEVELAITRASLQLRHAMLARNEREQQEALADIAGYRKQIEQTLQRYEKSLYTDKGKSQFARIPPVMDEFWSVAERNLALVLAGQKEQAFDFLIRETIPARNKVLAVVDEGVHYQEGALEGDIGAISDTVSVISSSLATVVILIAAGLLAFSFWMARLLQRRVAQARETAERVRDGDLSTPVRDDGRDEFSPLLAALQAMQQSLVTLVSHVRSSAEGVAAASTQIAQGNEDLSSRTEQQASALQQTSATAGLLGETARQNAGSASHASELAQTASRIAEQGGAVVGDAVQTMRDINDSSRRIGDIIGVIDGIAFQTNILALNAAVEAARAGEQGRGFAVVASEVRNLAQRSAAAAKDIKALINTSVERVAQGTEQVNRAGTTMQEVVQAIQRVTDIVGDISQASTEQSDGVAQVGEAVRQMDDVTQQNAALVEESAAAAAGLRQQARQMVEAVSVFRLAPA